MCHNNGNRPSHLPLYSTRSFFPNVPIVCAGHCDASRINVSASFPDGFTFPDKISARAVPLPYRHSSSRGLLLPFLPTASQPVHLHTCRPPYPAMAFSRASITSSCPYGSFMFTRSSPSTSKIVVQSAHKNNNVTCFCQRNCFR